MRKSQAQGTYKLNVYSDNPLHFPLRQCSTRKLLINSLGSNRHKILTPLSFNEFWSNLQESVCSLSRDFFFYYYYTIDRRLLESNSESSTYEEKIYVIGPNSHEHVRVALIIKL